MLTKIVLAFAAAFSTSAFAQFTSTDVTRFYQVYDAAKGRPGAAELQRGYLDGGSPGVQGFIPHRIVSADNLASRIARQPAIYEKARGCLPALATLQQRVPALIDRLKGLYPKTRQPQVSIVIGAGNSGGTVAPDGVIIGLEVACQDRAGSPLSLDERLVALVAHELVHTQQRGFADGSLLAASLNEGIGEFVGELLSGHLHNEHLRSWTEGRQAVLDARFRAAMHKRDLSDWIYNGTGTPDAPGDLGYWQGYRIAKAYYERSADKAAAIARLLEETDAQALLRDSGW